MFLKFLLAPLLCSPLFAESRGSALDELSKLSASLSEEFEIVDHGYAFNVESNPAILTILARDAESCKKAREFKVIPTQNVQEEVASAFAGVFEAVTVPEPRNRELKMQIAKLIVDLGSELKGKKLKTCTDESTPAYSDGHSITFIKTNGKLAFAIVVGYPD